MGDSRRARSRRAGGQRGLPNLPYMRVLAYALEGGGDAVLTLKINSSTTGNDLKHCRNLGERGL